MKPLIRRSYRHTSGLLGRVLLHPTYFALSTLSLVPLFLASTALADPRPYLVRHAAARMNVESAGAAAAQSPAFVGDGIYPAVDSACYSNPVLWRSIPPAENTGTVLVDPVVVGVFWPGAVAVDASSRALFPDFVKDLFDGPFWAAEMPQYVGSSHGSYQSSHDITLLTLAPSTTVLSSQIGPELVAQVAAGGLPAASLNTVYVVHFPPGITITDQTRGTSCVQFCAYHDYYSSSGASFPFIVQPDFTQNAGCQAGCGLGTPFDQYTEVLAHELIEATTDPQPPNGWENHCLSGEEVADVCESDLFYTPRLTASSGAPQCPNRWAMQAIYSNAAIALYGPAKACAVVGSTVDSTCVEPVAVCGNGVVEAGEQCDDGAANGTPGSCCSATCQNLPDSDGDGVCNALDVCTNIGGGQNFPAASPKPKLAVAKINTDTVLGNDTLTLSGSFVIAGTPPFSTVDPGTNGARVVVENGGGGTRIDATLPAGASGGNGTRGWKLSKKGNSWTYTDTTGTPLSGITQLVIVDKGAGRVQVKVTGKKGTYPVVAGDAPLKGIVVLGGQPQAEAGYCGETAFTAGDCLFDKKGTKLTCKP